jgi:dipeptide/tripeptide permease
MSITDREHRTVGGHPPGLFTLFFAEMWERFSFYGMRSILVFYLSKDFLRYSDADAYTVLASYNALVYMTTLFGGMLADGLLGQRRAVVLGGVLMALGHLLMTVRHPVALFLALGFLVCGNGFFKPNISTLVGSLYAAGSPKRDAGFTIFYMGINLGAGMAPLLCGYIGETYGWHYGFGLATIGMLLGVAVFVTPIFLAQALFSVSAALFALGLWVGPESQTAHQWNVLVSVLTLSGAVVTWMALQKPERWEAYPLARAVAGALVMVGAVAGAVMLGIFVSRSPFQMVINGAVALSLLVAALVACRALTLGALPALAGTPLDPQRLAQRVAGPLTWEWLVFLGAFAAVPVLTLVVSGFAWFTPEHRPLKLLSDAWLAGLQEQYGKAGGTVAVFLKELSRPAGLLLFASGFLCIGYLTVQTLRLDRIARQRMIVVLVLTFFSMLFWAFFEQAGSSLNNFADRNVDRVLETRRITPEDVGRVLRIQPTQEQVGHYIGDQLFTLSDLIQIRQEHGADSDFAIEWKVTPSNVGMGVASVREEIPASVFQSLNPLFILLLGLVLSSLWSFLGARGWEPSTPVKFALGLLQLGLGFAAVWAGTVQCDSRGMVPMGWLVLCYLLHTTGELCLSPVGLSMVTKLSPRHLVSTVMGTWFLATAFSELLAGIIAQFTAVDAESGERMGEIPPPTETVHVYGRVYGQIALLALGSGLFCLALSPLLTRWMHLESQPDRESRGTS